MQAAIEEADFDAALADAELMEEPSEELVAIIQEQKAAVEGSRGRQKHRVGAGAAVRFRVGQLIRHKRCIQRDIKLQCSFNPTLK